MLTPISTKIEEFENEGLPHSTVCYIKTFNDCDRDCPNKVAKDFLRTALQQRDEEVRQTIIDLARKKTQEFKQKGFESNHFVPLSLGEITDALGLDKYDECAEFHGDIITKSKEI